MTFSSLFGVGFGYWVFRHPMVISKWFWIKRYFPVSAEIDRIPPAKFVAFFRVVGLINLWGYALFWLAYWMLRITGMGAVGPTEPPANLATRTKDRSRGSLSLVADRRFTAALGRPFPHRDRSHPVRAMQRA